MTGLRNRRGFVDLLEVHCAHAEEPAHDDMLLLADVLGLGEADNRYGYAAGDHLLCQVAEALDAKTKVQDVSGRVWHDQFAVILCGDDAASRATDYAGDVQLELDRHAGERAVRLTVKFAAQSLAEIKTAEEALKRD